LDNSDVVDVSGKNGLWKSLIPSYFVNFMLLTPKMGTEDKQVRSPLVGHPPVDLCGVLCGTVSKMFGNLKLPETCVFLLLLVDDSPKSPINFTGLPSTTSVSVPSRGQEAHIVFVGIETMPITLARVPILEKCRTRLHIIYIPRCRLWPSTGGFMWSVVWNIVEDACKFEIA